MDSISRLSDYRESLSWVDQNIVLFFVSKVVFIGIIWILCVYK